MTKGEDYWNQIFSFKKASNPLFNEFISEMELLFLKEQLPRLRKGKALDLGFGNGRNSLFLARNQFQVIAIDNSEVAVNSLKNKAQSLSMSIETQKADIELHILGLLQYDTIIMTYYKPPVSRVFDEIIR
ncbi:MAG: methyltransferase domain-containing protein, partial [Bdellovibrionaceae bacterium]|nr:methyltransferase domain-containing protein [Pseudobdellovibrionaceae bacterium]